jgi:hypothetical protein
MNLDRITRTTVAITIALSIAVIVTRLYGLSLWPIVEDETSTVRYAAVRAHGRVNPAYYILVVAFSRLFGSSEWIARLPAALMGIISVPVFFLTWRTVLGRAAAGMGSLFIIFSSWHLWYSQFARFYGAVFLFGSIAYYLYYQAVRNDDLRYLAGGLVANVVGVFFHLTSVLLFAPCAAFSLTIILVRPATVKEYSRRIAGVHLALCALATLAALPFLWTVLVARREHAGGVSWGDLPPEMLLQVVRNMQLPIAVAAFFGLLFLWRRDVMKGLFFACGTGIPIVLLLLGSAVADCHAAYIYFAFPLFVLLAAYYCEVARQALTPYGVASWGPLALVLSLLAPSWISHYTEKQSLDIRKLTAFVEKEYRPDDYVVSAVWEFDYYVRDWLPSPVHIGHPASSTAPWAETLQGYKQTGSRTWIILPVWRQSLAPQLESWLLRNARLVWRKLAKRMDYTIRGYEVFLVSP